MGDKVISNSQTTDEIQNYGRKAYLAVPHNVVIKDGIIILPTPYEGASLVDCVWRSLLHLNRIDLKTFTKESNGEWTDLEYAIDMMAKSVDRHVAEMNIKGYNLESFLTWLRESAQDGIFYICYGSIGDTNLSHFFIVCRYNNESYLVDTQRWLDISNTDYELFKTINRMSFEEQMEYYNEHNGKFVINIGDDEITDYWIDAKFSKWGLISFYADGMDASYTPPSTQNDSPDISAIDMSLSNTPGSSQEILSDAGLFDEADIPDSQPSLMSIEKWLNTSELYKEPINVGINTKLEQPKSADDSDSDRTTLEEPKPVTGKRKRNQSGGKRKMVLKKVKKTKKKQKKTKNKSRRRKNKK